MEMLDRFDDFAFVRADQDIPAILYRLRPACGFVKRNARHSGEIGFLLEAAGIGQDLASVSGEHDGVEIANRGEEEEAFIELVEFIEFVGFVEFAE